MDISAVYHVPSGTDKNSNIFAGACVKFCRAYKIAHILQNYQIKILRPKLFKALLGHTCVKMAHAAGMDLNRTCSGCRYRLASTEESMSPPLLLFWFFHRYLWLCRQRMSLSYPEPGELIIFIRECLFRFNFSRIRATSASLSAKMLFYFYYLNIFHLLFPVQHDLYDYFTRFDLNYRNIIAVENFFIPVMASWAYALIIAKIIDCIAVITQPFCRNDPIFQHGLFNAWKLSGYIGKCFVQNWGTMPLSELISR